MLIKKLKNTINLLVFIRRLSVRIPRKALLSIYKSFISPHLYYDYILCNKLEKVQNNRVCLAIIGAIQGTSREKIHDKLGLHSLTKRHWQSKLFLFITY